MNRLEHFLFVSFAFLLCSEQQDHIFRITYASVINEFLGKIATLICIRSFYSHKKKKYGNNRFTLKFSGLWPFVFSFFLIFERRKLNK